MTTLQQQIEGVNKINDLTIKELKLLVPQLQNYIGKKILIQTGFSKNFNIEHLKIDGVFIRAYLSNSWGNLILNIDTTIKVGEFSCEYFKNTIYLAQISKTGILESVESVEQLIYDYKLDRIYNFEEIKNAATKLKDLEKEISKIKTDLSKFNLK